MSDLQAAMHAYWAAQTPDSEKAAYKRILAAGGPDGYAPQPTYADALRDAAAAIRAAGPATLRILPASHTGEVVLIDLAEAYAALVEGLGG